MDLVHNPPGDAFAQMMWRQALARAIRRARAEARDRHDPRLKEKLRKLYRTLWGGKQLAAEDDPQGASPKDPSDDSRAQHAQQERKPHD